MKRSLITVNGLKLFCRDTESTMPAILCLHGRWGRGETWTDFIGRYQDRYRVIAPDQRGHGLSDKPIARYAAEDFARDAFELLSRLECGPAIVVGHSMGGRMAAWLAALYPQAVRAVAILDCDAAGPETVSTIPPEKIIPVDAFTASWQTPYRTYDEALRDLSGRFSRPSNVRYFLESLVETVDGYDFLFSRYSIAAIETYQQRYYHILEQIRCPSLLVRAADSWCLSAEEAARMRGLMRDCLYFEVTDSDHMVYADNPDEFYPQFDRFLSRI